MANERDRESAVSAPRVWVERLTLTNFRNYAGLSLLAGPGPQVLVGPNGAGKTNLLEALSLLAPGQGLRRAPFADLARAGGDGGWAVAARVHARTGPVELGTGLPAGTATDRTGRIVRVDGVPQSGSGVLARHVEMVWVTPAMDGLFTGPAADRRRFLDRLTLCFDPAFSTRVSRFERAMRQRNRLLADGIEDAARFSGLELDMAETGVAVAAARTQAVSALSAVIARRRAREPGSPFPWAGLAIEGALEAHLGERPAVEVEDDYLRQLRDGRERDRAAGRTLAGPHRSDLVVTHGPKDAPARVCSTGEQKALLLGLVLAHAELVAAQSGAAPILLLDEVTAHLDATRRVSLFGEMLSLRAQAWLTGTDRQAFSALAGKAAFWSVEEGKVADLEAPRDAGARP